MAIFVYKDYIYIYIYIYYVLVIRILCIYLYIHIDAYNGILRDINRLGSKRYISTIR